jgi:hypothetical protein
MSLFEIFSKYLQSCYFATLFTFFPGTEDPICATYENYYQHQVDHPAKKLVMYRLNQHLTI